MSRKNFREGCVRQMAKRREMTIALAGNPNVGKSTLFNALTGMHQHTGNWTGKTVSNAKGYCERDGVLYTFVDVPGCYSLMARSPEEEAARDYICFQFPDAVIVVCDGTCLERNLNFVLQVMEAADRVILCINLMDEAEKKGISIDFEALESMLQIPVIGMTARSGRGMEQLFEVLGKFAEGTGEKDIKEAIVSRKQAFGQIEYPEVIEKEISHLLPVVREVTKGCLKERWVAARLMDQDPGLCQAIMDCLNLEFSEAMQLKKAGMQAENRVKETGQHLEDTREQMAEAFVRRAEEIAEKVVSTKEDTGKKKGRMADQILTSKLMGFPVMILLLLVIFWLTIKGANYPSEVLSNFFGTIEGYLLEWCQRGKLPAAIYEPLLFGVYRVTTWVVSVMLPPMAIFFPMFTILEDLGYLPRVAFNLDKCFHCCHACGKQALTMCMGFGCNAVGVSGCKIISSRRERLIAMLTNCFVPCNGKFPTILVILTIFFAGNQAVSDWKLALLLTSVITLGIGMTFLVSKILSGTILKGEPSTFLLELPPYRRPQIGKVIIRSVLDRTLFVLGRAIVAAAPAGLLIWCAANITVGEQTILMHCAGFLDPLGRFMGMDGVILLAFLLGFPANEIVLPLIFMGYLSLGNLTEFTDLHAISQVLYRNGWTQVTACSVILFSLMHWPCATTCLTIYKETKSKKWTLAAILIPTFAGILCCALFAQITNFVLR